MKLGLSFNKFCSLPYLPVLLGLIVGMFFFTFNILGFHFEYIPGDLGDSRLNLYFLEHAFKLFTGQLESYWDAPFMFPEKNVIAYSDNLLGSAPVYALFRLIGCDIYLSFQLWFVTVSVLNYLAAYYLLQFLFKNWYAAVIGALVFAFSIALQSQYTHAQVFPRYAIPLVILMLVRFSNDFNPRYFFFALLFLVYQIYCGIYIGFMLLIPAGIYLVSLLIFRFRQFVFKIKTLKWTLLMILSGVVNLLLLIPLMLPYLERKNSPSLEHFKQVLHTVPTLKSHFFSHSGSLLWKSLEKTGVEIPAFWDHQIFAGGVVVASVAIIGVISVKRLLKRRPVFNIKKPYGMLILAGLITGLIFLRIDKISAYILVYFLPGFSSMRSITRIINIELIFYAISVAFIIKQLYIKVKAGKFTWFLVLIVLFVVDNYVKSKNTNRTEKEIMKQRVSLLENSLSQLPAGSVFSYEPDSLSEYAIFVQLDAMLSAQTNNLVTINAYTATSPVEYNKYWFNPNEYNRNFWLAFNEQEYESFYVINEYGDIDKFSSELVDDFKRENNLTTKLNYYISRIINDSVWMQAIHDKSEKLNTPIDSIVLEDAKWMLEQEER